MNIEEVRINQKIYLINPDDGLIYKGIINAIYNDEFSFKLDGDNYEKDSNCKHGIARIKHKSYNSISFRVECLFNQTDLAIRKREIIIKAMDKIKIDIEKQMRNLKSFRCKNADVLNSTDIDCWIKEFSNNNQWV